MSGFSCTLPAGDLSQRVDDLRRLMTAALVDHRRDGRVHHLSFDPAAEADIRRAVALEQDCCAFLTFVVRSGEDAEAVEVDVTAPEGAEAVLDGLVELAPR